MFLSITSSKRITARSSPVVISTSRGSTFGTRTMAKSKSSSSSPSFFFSSAARFKDLLCTNGNGRDESTAMGVSTG